MFLSRFLVSFMQQIDFGEQKPTNFCSKQSHATADRRANIPSWLAQHVHVSGVPRLTLTGSCRAPAELFVHSAIAARSAVSEPTLSGAAKAGCREHLCVVLAAVQRPNPAERPALRHCCSQPSSALQLHAGSAARNKNSFPPNPLS